LNLDVEDRCHSECYFATRNSPNVICTQFPTIKSQRNRRHNLTHIWCVHLFLVIILSIITAILLLGGLGLLSPNTTRTSTAEWRAEGEVDVLLGVETDDEGGDVDDLLSNTDVSLADENTGVVDGLGETELVDAGLQTTLQEILNLQGQDVIELHAGLVEDTDTDETANQGVTFEETLGVLLVEGEQLTVFGRLACKTPPREIQSDRGGHTGQHDGSWTE